MRRYLTNFGQATVQVPISSRISQWHSHFRRLPKEDLVCVPYLIESNAHAHCIKPTLLSGRLLDQIITSKNSNPGSILFTDKVGIGRGWESLFRTKISMQHHALAFETRFKTEYTGKCTCFLSGPFHCASVSVPTTKLTFVKVVLQSTNRQTFSPPPPPPYIRNGSLYRCGMRTYIQPGT